MSINGSAHAAKCFYDVGNDFGGPVSKEENLNHLKDELIRQILASGCVQRFMDFAKENKVSVYSEFHW